MTGLFGGAFDPPHNGHLALARTARQHFGLRELVVLVVERPGHKDVHAPAELRLQLARLAFPNDDVRLDPHERTIDMLRASDWHDPLFLVGADEFCDLSSWKEPVEVLERARLGVATRPGFPPERLDAALARLERPERVELFAIEPLAVSSRDVRARVARGEAIDSLVPGEVAEAIARLGLYGGERDIRVSGLH